MEFITEGSQGMIFRTTDENGRVTAVKMVHPHLEPGAESFMYREYVALTRLSNDNHFPRLYSFGTIADEEEGQEHLILSMEYFGTSTLTQYIQKFRDMQTLIDPLALKKIMFQLCKAVSVCHSLNIMHRDLNGNNILVDEVSQRIKVIDFGSARLTLYDHGHDSYSPGVGRFGFVPPEVLMGSVHYTTAIDIWSLGIIFAQLATTRNVPIFGGATAAERLLIIFTHMGTPTEDGLPGVTELLHNIAGDNAHLIAQYRPMDLSVLVPHLDIQGIDLLSKMLSPSPQRRITALEAMSHPYFDQLQHNDKNNL